MKQRRRFIAKCYEVAMAHGLDLPDLHTMHAWKFSNGNLYQTLSQAGMIAWYAVNILGRKPSHSSLEYVVRGLSKSEKKEHGKHKTLFAAYQSWAHAQRGVVQAASTTANFRVAQEKSGTGLNDVEDHVDMTPKAKYAPTTVFNR